MVKISLFLPVRIGKKFENYKRWFESLSEMIEDKSNVEILVKFDDDESIQNALEVIENYIKLGFKIKYLVSPRGRGYNDISFFYAQLFLMMDPSSKMMMAGSIDLLFKEKGFDTVLVDAAKKYENDNIFVIHTTFTGDFSQKITNINIATQHCDNFPVWSRKWVEICGAHFGYCSSNDGYTGIVEYFLATEFGIDRRIDISGLKIFQESHGEGLGSEHWNKHRRRSIEINLSQNVIDLARQAAKNIAFNISVKNHQEDYTKFLIKSCLDNYDKLLRIETSNNNITSIEFYRELRLLKKKIRKIRKLVYLVILTLIPATIYLLTIFYQN